MKILKKVAVTLMVAFIGFSTIPTNTQAAITATVTTSKGKVTTTDTKTADAKTTKAKTTSVDAYILSRTKTEASFISTDGTKFTMPVVLDSSNKGDLVKLTFEGTLKKPSKIRVEGQDKAKTLVGTINQKSSDTTLLQINSDGRTYSFLKEICQMNVKSSTTQKVKVYYIDQTAVLVEAAK